MATTNAGNSQSRDEKPRFRTERPQGDRTQGDRREYRDFKGKGSYDRSGRENSEGKDNRNTSRGEYKPRQDYKSRNSFGGNKGYDRGATYAKDKDEDDAPVRRPKQTKSDKPKEQQTDKFEIQSRLEKEKKAMKKKNNDAKKELKTPKHQVKPKRSGNVDWTREYENGSYDDDELDMYY